MAVLDTLAETQAGVPKRTSPSLLLKAALTDPVNYDMRRIRGIREAVSTLRKKSRSFYLASAVFPGHLRIDLVLLWALVTAQNYT